MLDGDSLVFVEVKYRKNNWHGESIEQVTRRKREKLMKSALLYLAGSRRYGDYPCRFDIVGIAPSGTAESVEWIKNALETA